MRPLIALCAAIGCGQVPEEGAQNVCGPGATVERQMSFTDRGGREVTKYLCSDGRRLDSRELPGGAWHGR